MSTEPQEAADGEEKGKRFEMLCGVVIALFAAVLAITDLAAGKYGDDELIAHNEKSGAYLWYQSKGIKETQVEGQVDTLNTLVAAGSISPEQLPGVKELTAKLEAKVERYGKEKKEILLGSKAVGEANWAQDVAGEMGRVTGAKEWEDRANALGEVGDIFDYSTFFLQLCLVMGAISLVLHVRGLQRTFFASMILLGLAGTAFSVAAFLAAGQVP